MGATFTRRVQAALLSLVMLGSVGCARANQNQGNNANPGTTGAAVGGGTAGSTAGPIAVGDRAGNTAGPNAVGDTAGTAPGPNGAAANGAGGAARNGATGAALGTRRDLGQQVSDSVARLVGGGTTGTGFMGLGRTNGGAGTTDGDAAGRRTGADAGANNGAAGAARPVGVSTLIIGNLAFVALDLTTLPNGGATTGAAAAGGGATGGAAAGAGTMTRNGADGAGLLGGPTGGATGAGGNGTGLLGNAPNGTAGNGADGRTGAGTAAGNGGAGGATATGGVALESRIRSHILGAYPQVDEVYVTTDPTMVQRIARVTGEMQNGTSAAPRLAEIFAIANTMVGTTRDAGTTGTNGAR